MFTGHITVKLTDSMLLVYWETQQTILAKAISVINQVLEPVELKNRKCNLENSIGKQNDVTIGEKEKKTESVMLRMRFVIIVTP